MLTQRSRYGLRAMILLARETAGGPPVPMSHIAAEAVVPRKFLEIILTELKNANLVVSTRGKQGGFHLARPAELISFGDVIRVIEGPLALVPCVSRTAWHVIWKSSPGFITGFTPIAVCFQWEMRQFLRFIAPELIYVQQLCKY